MSSPLQITWLAGVTPGCRWDHDHVISSTQGPKYCGFTSIQTPPNALKSLVGHLTLGNGEKGKILIYIWAISLTKSYWTYSTQCPFDQGCSNIGGWWVTHHLTNITMCLLMSVHFIFVCHYTIMYLNEYYHLRWQFIWKKRNMKPSEESDFQVFSDILNWTGVE